jgi:hypothetical protein
MTPRRRGRAGGRRIGRDERAISTALGYVLTLAISSLLISGLMLAAGGFVESEREQVIRSELTVVGQTLIADTEGADRLAATIDGDVRVKSTLPRRVGSSSYSITITDGGFGSRTRTVALTADSVDVTVELELVTYTEVEKGTVDGGELVIVSTGGTLEVRNR